MKQKTLLLLTVMLTAFLFWVGCNKSSPPTQPVPVELKDTVNISVADVTHRSLSINVQCTMNNLQLSVSLYRTFNGADTLVANFPVVVKDTTIIDDDDGAGLLINTSYEYYAILTDTAGAVKEKTDPLTVSTLAPTSHNYTWQEYIIGDNLGFSSNALYDVWGTDENHVWAVGGVRINGTQYGVLYWNGTEWIPDSTAGGYAIYGFNNSDIWTVGGAVYHYDGVKWNRIDGYSSNGQGFPLDSVLFYSMPYTSIWGTSSNNLYLGNQWGKIIHWDGKKGSVVFSTDKLIWDLWGTDENNIYAATGELYQFTGELFHFNGSNWSSIRTGGVGNISTNTFGPFSSVWGTKNNELYLQAKYIESRTGNKWNYEELCPLFMKKITGTNSNNIFACGSRGVIKHFNGINWITYEGITNIYLNGIFATEQKVFIVGDGIILTGTKN